MASDANIALGGFVEAAEQVDDGGLATTGRTYQGDGLPAGYLEGKVANDRLVIIVMKTDMVKGHVARKRGNRDELFAVADGGNGVQEREDPL